VLRVQLLLQLVQRAVQVLVGAAQLVDLAIDASPGVVLVAELAADLRKLASVICLARYMAICPAPPRCASCSSASNHDSHAEVLGHGALKWPRWLICAPALSMTA